MSLQITVKSGYKQTEVGIIPKDWKILQIQEIAKVIRGASPRPKGDKRYYGGNIPRLMVKDVTRDGKFVTPIIDFLTIEGEKRSRPCKKGTLTIVCSGTVGIPSFLATDACVHDGFLALVDFKKNISKDYVYHQLSSLQKKFDSSATHGGVFTNLTTTIMEEFVVPFPISENEQIKIAEMLSKIDKLIKKIEMIIKKKKNIKQGSIQNLLSGKRRLGGFNDIWKLEKMKNIAKVIRGASPRPKGDKRYYGGNIPRLMVKDVTRDGKFVTPIIDFLTIEGEKRSRPCKKGTLTIVCSGTVGIPSFLATDACVHDGFLALVDFKKNISKDYVYHQLSSLQKKFDSSATHGGVFTNLTTTIMEEFVVAIPPRKEEQTAIAEILSDIDLEIKKLEIKRDKYIMIKNGMMQKLLTGEIRLV